MWSASYLFSATVLMLLFLTSPALEIEERPGIVFLGVEVDGYTVDISKLLGTLTNNWFAPSYDWRSFQGGSLQKSVSTTDAAIWRSYQNQLNANLSSNANIQGFLKIVNKARKSYATGTNTVYNPIVWSPNLAAGAQNYANCCPRKHSQAMWNIGFVEGLFGGTLQQAGTGMVAELKAASCTNGFTKKVTSSSYCGHGLVLLTSATVGCGYNPICSSVVCRYFSDYGLPSGNLYVYDKNCCNLHPQWYRTWQAYKRGSAEYSSTAKHAQNQPATCTSNGEDVNKYVDYPWSSASADTSRITADWPPVPSKPSAV